MSRHTSHLTFGIRQYAAAYFVYLRSLQGKTTTAQDIATAQNVSKVYATQLLEGWYFNGIIERMAIPYRKNVNRYEYRMPFTALSRFADNGYKALAEVAFLKVADHVRTERIDAIMRVPVNA